MARKKETTMRKYLSLKTMAAVSAVVAEKLATMTPCDDLRALYLADTELTEAIAAAKAEPGPKAPRQKRARKSNRTTTDAQPEA